VRWNEPKSACLSFFFTSFYSVTKLIYCSISEAEAGTQIPVRHSKLEQHAKTARLYPQGFSGPKQACWMLWDTNSVDRTRATIHVLSGSNMLDRSFWWKDKEEIKKAFTGSEYLKFNKGGHSFCTVQFMSLRFWFSGEGASTFDKFSR